MAAASGLTFVGLALVQNIIRAVTAPANDARGTTIIAHFVDHRSAELVLAATVVAGAFALALFVGHLWTRLSGDGERGWAHTGIIGATGIFAIFPIVVACEVALLVITDRPSAGAESVEALWAMHNAVFTVNMAALAVATLGLTLAALHSGLLPLTIPHHRPDRGRVVIARCTRRARDRRRGCKAGVRSLGSWLSRVVDRRRHDLDPSSSPVRATQRLN